MPYIIVVQVLAATVILPIVLIPRKKDYVYTSLDKVGIVLNIILSLAYIPMSIMGLFLIFFADYTDGLTQLESILLYIGIILGLHTPIASIGCILTSVIARKRGKSVLSFVFQFIPMAVFIIAVLLCFIAKA